MARPAQPAQREQLVQMEEPAHPALASDAKPQWVSTVQSLLLRVKKAETADQRRVEASQLMVFLSCTRQFWSHEQRFVGVVRQKLAHFRDHDNWPSAQVFQTMLFPDEDPTK